MKSIGPWNKNDKRVIRFKKEWNDVIQRFFGNQGFFDTVPSPANSRFAPVIDVEEKPDCYTIEAEIPKVDSDDIVVGVEGKVLTIKGEKREGKDRIMYLAERRYGTFKRLITLPENTNPDQIKAENHKGVLSIHIPKNHKTKRQRLTNLRRRWGNEPYSPMESR